MENKTALITGATSGIGLALAKIFAQNNYNLLLIARNKTNLNDTASKFLPKVKAWTLSVDLSEAESPRKIFNFCQNQNIQPDLELLLKALAEIARASLLF